MLLSSSTSIAQPTGVVCWTSQAQIIQQGPVPLQQQQPQHVSTVSWSLVDSADVADMIRGTLSSASRHSNWTRATTSSSWGSYNTGSSSNASSIQTVIEAPISMAAEEDLGQSGIFPYDKDEIPWHPGTVKRTKQKIEERSSSSIKRICSDKFGQKHPKCKSSSGGGGQRSNSEEALPSNRNAPGMVSSTYTRLSASAPDSYCLCSYGPATAQKPKPEEMPPPSQKGRRFSFRKSSNTSAGTVADEKKEKNDENTAISVGGIVRNLKMSFEAKVSSDRSRKEQKKVRSLPSSPVAIHIELNKAGGGGGGGKQSQQSNHPTQQLPNNQEDVTVRDLVGRYEAPKHRASFNTHHRHNSSSSASSAGATGDHVQVVPRQRPRSVFEPLKYAQNALQQQPQKPLMISHSTTLLKSNSGADSDFNRMPPIPPAGAPFVRGIIIGTSNNNNNNNNTSGPTGGSTGQPAPGQTTKKVVQHHGKTHPLAKINLTKHRINATSTTAATAYNTM